VKAELITELDRIAPFEDDWRELAVRRGNAFVSPEWLRAWWSATADHLLRIVVVRKDDGSFAGVMPLALDRPGSRGTLRFAGAALGDRFGPVSEPGDEGAVAAEAIRAIEAGGDRPAMTILHRVDAADHWPAQMAAASGRRLATVEQSFAELPYVPAAGLDWEGYLATRSSKFRQRIGRGLERQLAEKHSFAVRESAEATELEADLATLFRLHDLRHADDSSIANPRDRAILREFAGLALARGWLRMRLLEIEGEPAAATLAWRLGPRYAVYQGGFDPAWEQSSVGALMLALTVRAGIEEGAGEIDMLRGEEDYKKRFAPAGHKVRTVTLVPAWRPARLLVSAEAAARRRARGLVGHPRIGPALKRLARLMPTGRRD
jgi:CelD/BcsL family acetyltransferase involved in cellulose biosynthesis